jgi:phenylacetate-CoA ligase
MIKGNFFDFLLKLKGVSFKNQYKQIKDLMYDEDLLNNYITHFRKNILLHAYKNVPFYSKRLKEANVVNNEKVRLSNFESLPLLTRSDIQQNLIKLASRDFHKRRWHYYSTSGSTGTPMRFIRDSSDIKWGLLASKYYFDFILGIDELVAKKTFLMCIDNKSYSIKRLRSKIINWFLNLKFFNTCRITQQDLIRCVSFINSFKPCIIKSMPTTLYELCKFVEQKRLTVYQPKVVLNSFQKLYRYMRDQIEKVFGERLYDFYGSREISSIAGECKDGLLHIFNFNNYIEVLDEQNHPVKEGEMGKIVITDLHNYTMPFIRYEIGDLGILGPKRCKCGNPLPTLKEITGKSRDFFIREDGSLLNGGFFMYLFRTRDWIKAFRVIQEDYQKIKVLVVLQGRLNVSEQKEMDRKIKKAMGNYCEVIWEFVDEIPTNRNGKYLYIKSLLYDREDL